MAQPMNEIAKQKPQGLIRSTISGAIKIRDFKNTVPIEQALTVCFQLVGLRPKHMPSKDPEFNEWQFLIDFVKNNYGGLVVKEIELAFKLAVERKLNLQDDEIKVFDNFSPEYLGRIMNAYQTFRAKELSKTQSKTLPTPQKMTLEEDLAFFDTILFKKYRKALEGPYLFSEDEAQTCYRLLETMGFEIMNDKEKIKLFNETKLKYKHFRDVDKIEKTAKKECRSIAFKDFIQTSALEERDLIKEVTDKLKESH